VAGWSRLRVVNCSLRTWRGFLLAAQAQEWRRLMETSQARQKRPFGRAVIIDLAEAIRRRARRSPE